MKAQCTHACSACEYSFRLLAEPPVDQLADDEVQTSASKLGDRLESGVPPHGGTEQLSVNLLRSTFNFSDLMW